VAESALGLKGRFLEKKFVLPIKSWFFTFFHFLFFFMVLYDVIFNGLLRSECEFFDFFQEIL
jgi:hypothetical protein